MGIIRAVKDAIGGALTDQWLENYESAPMGPTTLTAPAVRVRKNDRRNQNQNATVDTLNNGSIIQVKEGQFMLLTDGGKIIDYTGEAGYFKVDNTAMPSLFNGEFGDAIKESFNRVRFGGGTSYKQKAYFINMQEVRGFKFGTPAPVNYYDNFYNAELFLRAHGTYTIHITDPIKFYIQVANHDADTSVDVQDLDSQFKNEFMTAFQTALNRMSADGQRISFVLSHGDELATYMQDVLDEKWQDLRGFQIESVAIASISYDEESQKLINMRNTGAMLSDASIREGYVQGSIARGLEAAGSNEAGAGQGFFGMGVGMSTIGGFGQFSANNAQEIQRKEAERAATTGAGTSAGGEDSAETGEFSGASVGAGASAANASGANSWTCPKCGTMNTGNFCTNCGTKKPVNDKKHCPNCGHEVPENARFCPNCGHDLSQGGNATDAGSTTN